MLFPFPFGGIFTFLMLVFGGVVFFVPHRAILRCEQGQQDPYDMNHEILIGS